MTKPSCEKIADYDSEYVTCYYCNGTGEDPVCEPECPVCGGSGERLVRWYEVPDVEWEG